MQTLNVMTNWQLQTNTSQQMFKVFAFGFDTRIKTISPLIDYLISDAVLDSQPCWNRFFRHFKLNVCVWCVPLTSAKCQFPGLAIWWVVNVSLVHLPDWASNHWLHQCSQQYVMCEVCHCPAVDLLCRFLAVFLKKVIQTAQTSSSSDTSANSVVE